MRTKVSPDKINQLHLQWTLWACFFLSYLMFSILVGPILSEHPSEDWLAHSFSKFAMTMAAVFLILSQVVSRNLILRSLQGLKDPTRDTILKKTLIPNIISWIFSEVIVIYGLTLAFKTSNPVPLYIFAAVAAINMLSLRPHPNKWLGHAG